MLNLCFVLKLPLNILLRTMHPESERKTDSPTEHSQKNLPVVPTYPAPCCFRRWGSPALRCPTHSRRPSWSLMAFCIRVFTCLAGFYFDLTDISGKAGTSPVMRTAPAYNSRIGGRPISCPGDKKRRTTFVISQPLVEL